MKSIRSLILIAIGMMVFTATAHTAKLEQKQKAEFTQGLYPTVDFVCVNDFQFVTVFAETTIFSSQKAFSFRIVNDPFHSFAIVTDVGWKVSKQQFRQIHYKEKLLENYILHFKDKLLYPDIKVRDNC